jgi:hypothetical protein
MTGLGVAGYDNYILELLKEYSCSYEKLNGLDLIPAFSASL